MPLSWKIVAGAVSAYLAYVLLLKPPKDNPQKKKRRKRDCPWPIPMEFVIDEKEGDVVRLQYPMRGRPMEYKVVRGSRHIGWLECWQPTGFWYTVTRERDPYLRHTERMRFAELLDAIEYLVNVDDSGPPDPNTARVRGLTLRIPGQRLEAKQRRVLEKIIDAGPEGISYRRVYVLLDEPKTFAGRHQNVVRRVVALNPEYFKETHETPTYGLGARYIGPPKRKRKR
jgi:hypothetical protein